MIDGGTVKGEQRNHARWRTHPLYIKHGIPFYQKYAVTITYTQHATNAKAYKPVGSSIEEPKIVGCLARALSKVSHRIDSRLNKYHKRNMAKQINDKPIVSTGFSASAHTQRNVVKKV